mmetsp:Transcript_80818/g.168624  ORF Transcript_80818/g.168624 Transcript_80818/m.168624 type:complete len:143 (-) Transcript_80818:313-741(-)
MLNSESAASSGGPAHGQTGNRRAGNKKTCRFYVGIEQDPSFQVCRRLIGIGGSNMKKIIASAPDAKIRIRGRGSKYLEGPEEKESNEELMICISATTSASYEAAARLVKELLEWVHEEYRQFCRSHGLPEPRNLVVADSSGG